MFLELILATLLISVALVGILGGFRTVIVANSATSDRMLGRLLAEQKIADLEKVGVFRLGTSEGEFSEFPGFHWQVDVRETPSPSLFRFQLTVSWPRDSMVLVLHLCKKDSTKGGGL